MESLLKKHLADSTLRVLGLDPGQTTGACVFIGSDLIDARQLATGLMPDAARTVELYIEEWKPDVITMEDYRVYSWKADDHKWAGLHTPRLIGAIEYMCAWGMQMPRDGFAYKLIKRMAQQAKGFVTDDKLKAWGLYQVGERHARDAIRHAVYHLLFEVAKIQGVSGGSNDSSDKGQSTP